MADQTLLFIGEEAADLPPNLHQQLEAVQGGPLDSEADDNLLIPEAELYGVKQGFYPDTEDSVIKPLCVAFPADAGDLDKR